MGEAGLAWFQFQSDALQPGLQHSFGLFHARKGGMEHREVISVPNQGWFPFLDGVRLLNRRFHPVQRDVCQQW